MSRVEGVDYTPEGIESVRQLLIELRDGALQTGWMHYAVGLSHAIAYLSEYREVVANIDRAFDDLESGRST